MPWKNSVSRRTSPNSDFEERLGLLVNGKWLWKENRGFVVRLKNAQLKICNATLEDSGLSAIPRA